MTNKKRFIQICADRGIAPGSTKGAAQHLRGIASGLTALGHCVDTITAREPEGPFPVPVYPIDQLDGAVTNSADVIYERYSLGHRQGLDLARRLGVPFVLEVNAPLVDEAAAHRPGSVGPDDRHIERVLLAEADLVVVVSGPLRDWAAAYRDGPTVTISNGFEPVWFPKPAQSQAARYPLVFVGHPKPWHGADRIVDILRGLRDRGITAQALLIGGGAGIAEIEIAAQRHSVSDQLRVTGALTPQEASELLATSAIGLAPYRRQEPFYFCPLKVVDYMAAGLAVVASDLGDCGSLLAGSGVLVDPDDTQAFVDAVQQLLEDPRRCARLGQQSRDRAFTALTWEHAATTTVASIEALGAFAPVGS